MLDGIDALVALETFGTVSEAATRLRLTQSAVSKRLAALGSALGFRLVVPDGRRLRLTPRAVELVERARPLVAELRGLSKPTRLDARASFSVALADSIASSWGPAVVRAALRDAREVDVDLHAHRSVLVVESVRLGRYDVGMCTESTSTSDLVARVLVDEPMVLVSSALSPKLDRGLPLITIEPTSATWRAIHPQLRLRHERLLSGALVFVESFGAVVQMTRAGFGNGLVPLGLARDARLPPRSLRPLGGVARRVSLLSRKSTSQQPAFVALADALARVAQQHFAQHDAAPGRSRRARMPSE
jgi:DNA-binding transcriptional LysR family regulator